MKPPYICWIALGVGLLALGFAIPAFAMTLVVMLNG